MQRAYIAALACGAVPLVLGMTIFSLWRVTGAEWLMFAGALNIWLGCFFVAAGCVSLTVHVRRARAAAVPAWRTRVFAAGALLLLNFPAAAMLVAQASAVHTTFTVTVVNRSPLPLEALTVTVELPP